MGLEPGRMLGGFRLIAKIGEGGMGVVWKALDTSLDRAVAIKVLPDAFAADSERMVRFEREAKVLASLDHPGIATIHGFHQIDGIRFIAMEHIDGVDLAHRTAQGALPIEEGLDIALQVALALEVAHDSGVVHRDLKPANILVGTDGRTRILDFGLAKALDADAGPANSLSPTLTTPATHAGVIIGTAAYMSPEQAKGKPVDRRADVWAFGCILYEMLTGKRPFSGDGVSEILAAVIMSPVDMQQLPVAVPEPVRRLLKRCMEKDPKRRLRDIGEARFVIEETLAGRSEASSVASSPAAARRSRLPILPLIAAAILAAAATWILMRQLPAPATELRVRRFEIPTDKPLVTEIAAISPDGSHVAYLDGQSLKIRPLDRLQAAMIETGVPAFIFWSPDGRWLAWASDGKLWKVAAEGGTRAAIADIPGSFEGGAGASWGAGDRIVLSRGDGDLQQVPARGGDLAVLLKHDEAKEDDFHQPHLLPDGSVLFVTHVVSGRPDTLEVLINDQRRVLHRIESQSILHPVYSSSGHILYRREPTNPGIWALPFSLADHAVTGEPFLVVPDGNVPSVSSDGTLVHVIGSTNRVSQIVRVSRDGTIAKTIGRPQEQWPFPALSPDGGSVAIGAAENEADELWTHDSERGTSTRLTFNDNTPHDPRWSPRGDMIAYQQGIAPPFTLTLLTVDGKSEPRSLGSGYGASWSPDGRMILYAAQTEGDWDLYYREIAEGAEPVLFLKAADSQYAPALSPDGKYVAYVSHETRKAEIYIKGFPGGEGKWQVSSDGGHWPRWSRSGRSLYYTDGETLMEVDVQTAGSLRLGSPRALFTREELGWPLIFGWPPGFDVTADEREFIFCQPVEKARDKGSIVVVENWMAGLD